MVADNNDEDYSPVEFQDEMIREQDETARKDEQMEENDLAINDDLNLVIYEDPVAKNDDANEQEEAEKISRDIENDPNILKALFTQ